MSPRFGTFSHRSESTNRSNANVTVLRGTFASLLITLGERGPLFVKNVRIRRALFGSFGKFIKDCTISTAILERCNLDLYARHVLDSEFCEVIHIIELF